jgi:hypothetical protein
MRLLTEIVTAARTLINTLKAGGYMVKGMELPISGSIADRALEGFIDCLVVKEDGEEAVIDFKYMGRNKYSRLLTEGHAVQLATYAYARSQKSNGRFPGAAYLILADALLLTLKGSPLAGLVSSGAMTGPPIDNVWNNFYSALKATGSWLTGGPVPCWPLQDLEKRPPGTEMVIEKPDGNKSQEEVEPCKYCDYKILCGIKELE